MYFLTSGLGVANELFEFALTKMHIMRLTPTDAWWDLAANTTGVFSFWLLYSIFKIVRK
jgi:fucose 4-O-acetylase-like acetyltransferase